MLDCIVFIGVSDAKMQRAKLFGPQFLAAGDVMLFAFFHVVGSLLLTLETGVCLFRCTFSKKTEQHLPQLWLPLQNTRDWGP